MVTVNVKVVEVMEPQLVPTGKRKQDVIISDKSSTATVTLWEEHINSLDSNCCYCLKGFVVREYNCSKYLAMSFKGSEIIPIGDIGEVCQSPDETKSTQIYNATIIGVKDLGSNKICIRCNARVEPTKSNQGRCTKEDCRMLQRYDMCPNQLSAKVVVMSNSKMYSLTAYSQTVKDLAGVGEDEVKEEDLIEIPQLKSITFNDTNVITHFTK